MDRNYRIIVDSCCELPEAVKQDLHFVRIPMTIEIDGEAITDDDMFDQSSFLDKLKNSRNCPKSACPSPAFFLDAFQTEAKRIYVVTLSSKLSGSFNSACVAKRMLEEENDEKEIFVIDSRSASCGETQIALLIRDLEENKLPFEEIKRAIRKFVDGMKTYFVLDDLSSLQKSGRLARVKSMVATKLHMKPVLVGTPDGEIEQKSQAVGIRKAIHKMVETILSEVKNTENRRLVISHCNCEERAQMIRNLALAHNRFKEVIILNTAGISSMYANDGGVIMTI